MSTSEDIQPISVPRSLYVSVTFVLAPSLQVFLAPSTPPERACGSPVRQGGPAQGLLISEIEYRKQTP